MAPLTLRRNLTTAEILMAREARQARRERQFWLARWFARLLTVGAVTSILVALLAYFAPSGGAEVTPDAVQESLVIPPAAVPAVDLTGYTPASVHLSHYWPDLGGVNCYRFSNGHCRSGMSDGEPWQDHVGEAAACVPSWPFGTLVILPGGEQFTCRDRGGGIITGPDGIPWLDLLVEYPPVPYGAVVAVQVKFP